jgi:hypothetical protein
LGVSCCFDPGFQVRVTFDLNGLIGSEQVSGVGQSLDTKPPTPAGARR